MKKKILFLCTGNTCRSAMAAYLGAAMAEKQYGDIGFRFDSAGLMAADGSRASQEAADVLGAMGLDMSGHRSKAFRREMGDKADLLVVMTASHKRFLLEQWPELADRTFTLGELSGSLRDVPDPYCGSFDLYQKTRDMLVEDIGAMLERLSSES
ncbi:MAG: low molecular weight protein arginine phosphatase [Bacillota bacterium]|nr:low molecular weight protein arginine phosphatase [Bacillota bacterium]